MVKDEGKERKNEQMKVQMRKTGVRGNNSGGVLV